jgi:glycerol kinase
MALLLSIDQGTTGNTAFLMDDRLNVLAKSNREFPQIFPQPGWVEHDPDTIWAGVKAVIQDVLKTTHRDPKEIAAIGITNQRETTVLWERATGKPVHNAVVWQDRRTAAICDRLKKAGHEALYQERTGLVLDPYFSGTKLTWLFENLAGLRARAQAGEIAFGTIDSFLLFRLTGGKVHATDVSNASRTLLFDLHTHGWSDELLAPLGVPREILPQVRASSEVYGVTRGLDFLPDGIPVAGMAGDQQSALFGQLCLEPGAAKCTYGTGSFTLMNTGERHVKSENGLLTTVAWKLGDGPVIYALEGSAFIAGAAVQWLRDGLGIIKSSSEIEALALQVADAGGVVFVPALTGLGAPHWKPGARGVITGLTRGTTKAHLARAALEGIAFQNYEILKAMEEDAGAPLTTLKVDGGASANNLLMQFQCDLLDRPIVRPKMLETTALGAALLAGLAVKVWPNTDALKSVWQEERTFKPVMKARDRSKRVKAWKTAVRKA